MKPALAARLREAQQDTPSGPAFAIEADRVRRVLKKLAKGHSLFELSEVWDDDVTVTFLPLQSLTAEQRAEFEAPAPADIWPEVGSRSLISLVEGGRVEHDWVNIQAGRYRYLAAPGMIRIVFSEYLAVEVRDEAPGSA